MHGHALHKQFVYTATPPLFLGPKCNVAIPLESSLQRDALREASLDPAVCTIHYRAAPNPYGSPPTLKGVVLERIDGDFLLDVCRVRPRRSEAANALLAEQLAATGLRLLERDAADIRREPIYSNVHEVWTHEHYPVPILDRLRIGAALCESGPQTVRELHVRARPDCHPLSAVCALSCEGLITVDVHEGALGERTMVRPI